MNKVEYCYWTTNIAEQFGCSPDGDFDENGFPLTECEHKKDCKKWRHINEQDT